MSETLDPNGLVKAAEAMQIGFNHVGRPERGARVTYASHAEKVVAAYLSVAGAEAATALAEKERRIGELTRERDEASIAIPRSIDEQLSFAASRIAVAEWFKAANEERSAIEVEEFSRNLKSEMLRVACDLAAPYRDRAEKAEATLARVADVLRGHWHGVFLDGRNEHGSHVLMLPQRSIEFEQDSNGDFLKSSAEAILFAAEAKGFVVGDAVVATFDICLDEGFFSHYEFAEVSDNLTALFYGTHHEQAAARALYEEARALAKGDR